VSHDHISIRQSVTFKANFQQPVDIYKLVAELQRDFPTTPRQTLIDIVNEEVISARANAMWLNSDNRSG
jgi:hypothetical protein